MITWGYSKKTEVICIIFLRLCITIERDYTYNKWVNIYKENGILMKYFYEPIYLLVWFNMVKSDGLGYY